MPEQKNTDGNSKDTQENKASQYPLDRYSVAPDKKDEGKDKSPYYKSAAPEISLPKGGGALKGIDEKFSVNAINGTAGLQVAFPLSPARSGFTPSLSVSYSSGGGNSEFGLGWSLSLPSIQRRTDKLLPAYDDAHESDVFILAGAEDMVPEQELVSGVWQIKRTTATTTAGTYVITRYMPRIEGLYARIELIKKDGRDDCWWRVTTKDNITTYYGLTAEGRVSDPSSPIRIFKWLPQLMCDHRGNIQQYVYLAENTDNVLNRVHENNRLNGTALFANTYLQKVQYCNDLPYFIEADDTYEPVIPVAIDYLMEAVLDYGEYDDPVPVYTPVTTWPCRKDPFSDFHAGFEIRTYRKCRRVVMYHSFRELNAGSVIAPVPVRSLDFTYQYDSSPADTLVEADFIITVTQTGYLQKAGGGWAVKSLPPITLEHQPLHWNTQWVNVSKEDAENAPQGITGPYHWIDLWGEGLPGILTEQGAGQGWYYKQNLGNGHFTPAIPVASKPSFSGFGTAMQWEDLNADGRRQLVSRDIPVPGYFELDDEQHWQAFIPFKDRANINWQSPFTRLLDLDGDGRADALIAEDRVWTWYRNEGTDGYTLGGQTSVFNDEEKSPKLLFTDELQSVFLADINGDGLTDLVRIKNGEVSYWPNMGYGNFGAKVAMSNAPFFDHSDIFNPIYITVADISGTGAADIIYIGPDNNCTAWINYAGNAFGPAQYIGPVPGTDPYSKIAVIDFLGNGTGCLVWSSPLPEYASNPMRYIDLMGGNKPFLLRAYNNGLGKTIALTYKSSALFYAEDKMDGLLWATRLPFPVQCISQVETSDTVSQTIYTQSYRYHHGYYDHEEREFRGFGRVDTVDADAAIFYEDGTIIENDLDQSPVLTRTWYHTGAWMRETTLLDEFKKEYFQFDGWDDVTVIADFPAGMDGQENREAHRALKSSPLRQEVYALDGTASQGKPYTVTAYAYGVHMLQPVGGQRYGCFYNYQQQSIAFSCERNTADPRILHSLTVAIDAYGNVLEAAQITYPRADTSGLDPLIADVQTRMLVSYSVNAYTNDAIDDENYRLRVGYEASAYQVHNLSLPLGAVLWTSASIQTAFTTATLIAYTDTPGTTPEKRPISLARTLFLGDDTTTILGLGIIESLGISYNHYALAFTDGILNDAAYYDGLVTDSMLAEGGYLREDLIPGFGSTVTNYWIPGGTVQYSSTPTDDFYSPVSYTDPWGNVTTVDYWSSGTDNYYLLPLSVTDAVGNTNTVLDYRWESLQPLSMQDANDNIGDILYDALGMPVATALRGKGTGTEGDTLAGLDPDDPTDIANQAAFWAATDPTSYGKLLLKGATWRCIYDLDVQPVAVAMIARDQHYVDNPASDILIRITFTDGMGRVAMNKVQAAPAEGDTVLRWIGSGKTVYNNKGKVVLQYEPYFSGTPLYDPAEQAALLGVSPRMHYDALGRNNRTDLPDGSYTKTEWDAWKQVIYDNNDTVLSSQWYIDAIIAGGERADAANKAAHHDDTPFVSYLDTLARAFYMIQHDKYPDPIIWTDHYYASYTELNITGNRILINDARTLDAFIYSYNMVNADVRLDTIDSGVGRMLINVAGNALYAWDADNRQFRLTYDAIGRQLTKEVLIPDVVPYTNVLEQMVYGEGQIDDKLHNLRGTLYQGFDGSGSKTIPDYDFKGNPLQSEEQFLTDYTIADVDWASSPALNTEVFTTSITYDALDRPVTATDAGNNITRHEYNESGALFAIYLTPDGGSEAAYVTGTYHNAKGQRVKIYYANGTNTAYTYDPNTFRLTRLLTKKATDTFQDLNYWYDPVGNVTTLKDDSQRALYFNNSVTLPAQDYTYDALYRLIIATGREEIGIATFGSNDNYNDSPWMGINQPGDNNNTQNYTQKYKYDEVGNILELKHSAGSGSYTRSYLYDTASNKLLSTTVGAYTYNNDYDVYGNVIQMPHLSSMIWNTQQQLSTVDLGGGGDAYYQYSGAIRSRKVIKNGSILEERLYMGSYEVYRKYISSVLDIERTTVHVSDDTGRIAMLEVRTVGTDPAPASLIRYIYSNHLGTASLELDDTAAIISYEEYHPYGTTSYQAINATINAVAKRYRYTGMERDEETGLYYIGARYYAPWLTRWIAVDPINHEWYNILQGQGGRNSGRQFVELTASVYEYCFANPVRFIDPSGEQPGPTPAPPAPSTPPAPVMGMGGMGMGGMRSPNDNTAHTGMMQQTNLQMAKDGKIDTGTDMQREIAKMQAAEPTVLMADVNGKGHMGPESVVKAEVNYINMQRTVQTGENMTGIGGTIGFMMGGDKGSDIGAVMVDNVMLGMHFQNAETKPMEMTTQPEMEPKKVEMKSAEMENKVSLSQEDAAKVNPDFATQQANSPEVQAVLEMMQKVMESGSVNKPELKDYQEVNMIITQGDYEMKIRIETHDLPVKLGGKGDNMPVRHMNVELRNTKTGQRANFPNGGHIILK